ncbi:MAG: hypothetical protein C0468_05330, partial [Planctomyces sp.]|nr:hypothetical protein [Planctomyces sp.]
SHGPMPSHGPATPPGLMATHAAAPGHSPTAGSNPAHGPATAAALPYKVACLCDLRDEHGRVLLLHRLRAPNQGLISPIGGKLDMATGESPAACAQREIREEAGLDVPLERLRLLGLISESAFEGRGHWLIFYYRVLGSVWIEPQQIPEGQLRWHHDHELDTLPIPETDRRIIWPLVRANTPSLRRVGNAPPARPFDAHEALGFFAVHIDCVGPDGSNLAWRVEQTAQSP